MIMLLISQRITLQEKQTKKQTRRSIFKSYDCEEKAWLLPLLLSLLREELVLQLTYSLPRSSYTITCLTPVPTPFREKGCCGPAPINSYSVPAFSFVKWKGWIRWLSKFLCIIHIVSLSITGWHLGARLHKKHLCFNLTPYFNQAQEATVQALFCNKNVIIHLFKYISLIW